MKSGWRDTTFGDIFEISSSKRVLQKQWKTTGVPFYRAREIVKLAKEGCVTNELFISDDLFREFGNNYGVPKAGDLMVSAVGTLGACYVVQPQDRFYYKDASVLQFSAKQLIHPPFFQHAFRTNHILDQIHSGSGSTVGTYTISRAKETRISLPPLAAQKRIAAILDAADALRAKRREALAQLDALLQSTFLTLFGDPVTNPKQWPVATIGDLLSSTAYGTSKKAHQIETGVPCLRMNNITFAGGWDFMSLKYVDLEPKEISKNTVQKGQILFNRTNSKELVGKTAVYRRDEPMAFAGYLVRGITNSEADAEYISAYLNLPQGKAILQGMCKSIVGMANINAQEFKSISIPKPPLLLQQKFSAIVESVERQKSTQRAHLADLDALFASLQHRAFRGEL
ncbi:MAG: restriction endonuclease subunit S [Verrucomicrobiales bacterium]